MPFKFNAVIFRVEASVGISHWNFFTLSSTGASLEISSRVRLLRRIMS